MHKLKALYITDGVDCDDNEIDVSAEVLGSNEGCYTDPETANAEAEHIQKLARMTYPAVIVRAEWVD